MPADVGRQGIDELLDRFPGPLSLYPSVAKALAMTMLAVIMTAASIFVITIGELLWGWIGTIFFGFFSIPQVRVLLFAHTLPLTLDRDGFRAANGLFRWNCRWSEVGEFETQRNRGVAYITFNNKSPLARVRIILGFGTDWLQSIYRIKATDLALLLNGWRERALARGAKVMP